MTCALPLHAPLDCNNARALTDNEGVDRPLTNPAERRWRKTGVNDGPEGRDHLRLDRAVGEFGP
jgi:hypothetical protein